MKHEAEQFILPLDVEQRPVPFEHQYAESAMILQAILKAGALELYFADDGRLGVRPTVPKGQPNNHPWRLIK